MFRKDFVWGAATAAYQIEGGVREDGRTQSVWDMLCERAGAVCNGDTGETACDFYHRYREDIAMMKRFGIRAFRMSFSWNRIFPEGTGAVNEKGLDFYDRVVDELLKNGIVPYVTLLHWDLPRALYERGGYMNPDFCNWFADYARVVARHFSDRVKNFFTFNEPQLILGAHRGSGKAPALSLSDAETVPVAHHILLAHGRAVRAMRAEAGDLALGMANQGCFFYPVSDTPENEAAAKRETFEYRRPNWYSSLPWYADPVFLGKYPESLLSRLEKYLPAGWEKDMAEIAEPIDFCGQNFYNAFPVDEKGESVPFPPGTAYNSEHWNVSPSGLYYSVKWQYERYRKPVLITENGMCCHDWISMDGKVHDPQRIDFLRSAGFVKQMRRLSGNPVRRKEGKRMGYRFDDGSREVIIVMEEGSLCSLEEEVSYFDGRTEFAWDSAFCAKRRGEAGRSFWTGVNFFWTYCKYPYFVL